MIYRRVVVRSVPVSGVRHRGLQAFRLTRDLTDLQRDRCAREGERYHQREEALDHRIEYTAHWSAYSWTRLSRSTVPMTGNYLD